jgi:hypothetical protein
VYSSYGILYMDMGNLLLSILKAQPLNEGIALRVKEWLSIKPTKKEVTLYREILETVAKVPFESIMFNPEVLSNKRREINEIFAAHGDFTVSILGSTEPDLISQAPDVEIVLNMDEIQDDDIVVFITKNSQVIQNIPPHERHDFCMHVFIQLKLLLGCKVNVVDERGLQSSYPATYSNYMTPATNE